MHVSKAELSRLFSVSIREIDNNIKKWKLSPHNGKYYAVDYQKKFSLRQHSQLEMETHIKNLPGIEIMELQRYPSAFDQACIGTRLKLARIRRGWNQQNFAKAAGLCASTLCRWERGDNPFSGENLAVIANTLNCEFDELLAELRSNACKTHPLDPNDLFSREDLKEAIGISDLALETHLFKIQAIPVVWFPKRKYSMKLLIDTIGNHPHSKFEQFLMMKSADSYPGIESSPLGPELGFSHPTANNIQVRTGIGRRIKRLRKARKLTLENVVNKLGISPSLWGEFEAGERIPEASRLQPMADLFNLSFDELIKELSNPAPGPLINYEIEENRARIGARLRELRKIHRFKTDSVVGTGISPYVWSAYENGRRDIDERHWPVMAKLFHITPEDLRRYVMRSR